MVRGEESALYSEGDHGGRGCDGSEYQVHHCRLYEDGVERADSGQNQAGHGAGKYDDADRFRRFDLGNERGAERSSYVEFGGDGGRLSEREAREES